MCGGGMSCCNCWTGISEAQFERCELDMLKLSGMEQYEIEDVVIDHEDGNQTIHTYIFGTGKPLLLLHGYGGASLVFYPIIKKLAEHFCVYAIDLPGMAGSSRHKWRADTVEECEEYFVSRLELWREAVGLEKFVVVAHSLGGYVASLFTISHPGRVSQLHLLSPVGLLSRPDHYDVTSRVRDLGCWKRMLTKFYYATYRWGCSLFWILRCPGRCNRRILRSYTRSFLLPEEISDLPAMEEYIVQYLCRTPCSELALNKLLDLPYWGHNPIESRIVKIEVPVSFYYGDRDWVSPFGAEKIVEKRGRGERVYIVPNAGHQLFLNNSSGLIKKLFKSFDRLSDKEANNDEFKLDIV